MNVQVPISYYVCLYFSVFLRVIGVNVQSVFNADNVTVFDSEPLPQSTSSATSVAADDGEKTQTDEDGEVNTRNMRLVVT